MLRLLPAAGVLLAAGVLALALAPVGAAQPDAELRPGQVTLELRPHAEDVDRTSPAGRVPLYAGLDNAVRFTVRNGLSSWWNATFEVNATGGYRQERLAVAPERVEVRVPPRAVEHVRLVLRPTEYGVLELSLASPDASLPQSDEPFASVRMDTVVLPATTVRMLHPAPEPAFRDELGEYERVNLDGAGGPRVPGAGYLRVRQAEPFTPRVEVRNPLDVDAPPFTLVLRHGGEHHAEVPSLPPGGRHEVAFPPQRAMSSSASLLALTSLYELPTGPDDEGAFTGEAVPGWFVVRNGSVQDVVSAVATVDVVRDIVLDVYVPKAPRLGEPTRIVYRIENLKDEPSVGEWSIGARTPGGLHYGVQGPVGRTLFVRLAPGEWREERLDLDLLVSGRWDAGSSYLEQNGLARQFYGRRGGASFMADGGISPHVLVDGEALLARLGEPLSLDVRVEARAAYAGAELRVASSVMGAALQPDKAGGEAGLAARLLQASPAATPLGDLASGAAVERVLEVVSDGSGPFVVVPFVLVDGVAHTGSVDDSVRDRHWFATVAVQPRALPPAWGLAPLALGLLAVLGAWQTWTRRTR